MRGGESAVEHLAKNWAQEFSRAVDMFTGQPVAASVALVDEPSSHDGYSFWAKQDFVEQSTFSIWIGTKGETLSELGAALGAEDVDSQQTTYLEILSQANQGCVAVTNLQFGLTLRCEATDVAPSPGFDPDQFALFAIDLGAGSAPVLLAIELKAGELLDETSPAMPANTSSAESIPDTSASRLSPIKLTVAVSVGKMKLRMRTALQLRSGTLVRLDSKIDAPAELLVQGCVVARGEIVVIEGQYGFRVTQIVSQEDRLNLCQS